MVLTNITAGDLFSNTNLTIPISNVTGNFTSSIVEKEANKLEEALELCEDDFAGIISNIEQLTKNLGRNTKVSELIKTITDNQVRESINTGQSQDDDQSISAQAIRIAQTLAKESVLEKATLEEQIRGITNILDKKGLLSKLGTNKKQLLNSNALNEIITQVGKLDELLPFLQDITGINFPQNLTDIIPDQDLTSSISQINEILNSTESLENINIEALANKIKLSGRQAKAQGASIQDQEKHNTNIILVSFGALLIVVGAVVFVKLCKATNAKVCIVLAIMGTVLTALYIWQSVELLQEDDSSTSAPTLDPPTPAPASTTFCKQLNYSLGKVCDTASETQISDLETAGDNLIKLLDSLGTKNRFPYRLQTTYSKLICNSTFGDDWSVFSDNFKFMSGNANTAIYKFVNENYIHYSSRNVSGIYLYGSYNELFTLPKAGVYFYQSKLRVIARELLSLTNIPKYNTNISYLTFNQSVQKASETSCEDSNLVDNVDTLSFFLSSAFLLYKCNLLNNNLPTVSACGKIEQSTLKRSELNSVIFALRDTLKYLSESINIPPLLADTYKNFICNNSSYIHWSSLNKHFLQFYSTLNNQPTDFIFPNFNSPITCGGEIARAYKSASQGESDIYLCNEYFSFPTLYKNSTLKESENRTKLQIIAHEYCHISDIANDQYYGYNECILFANQCGINGSYIDKTLDNTDCIAFFIQSTFAAIKEYDLI